jgi:anti-sigma factor (TIGR02949 family)
MECRKVLSRLSEFIDDALDPNTALQVSQHLNCCENCRKEYESLKNIQQKLRSISITQTPKHLRNLIQIRISARREPWQVCLRNALERRWSIIRTTEGIYYWTKALGTAMTAIFFFLITIAGTPYYMDGNAKLDENARNQILSPEYRQQLAINVMKIMSGEKPQPEPKITGRRDPAIHPQYLLNLGRSVSESGRDETASVVAVVDPDGAAKTQDVLEYPSDQTLLSSLNEMIATARCRPASKNGQTIPSHMILMFSTISVHN